MFKAEIAGKNYTLPSGYRDITLGDYIKLHNVIEAHPELPSKVNSSNEHKFLALYKDVFLHFIPLSEDVFNKIPKDDVANVCNMLNAVLIPPKQEGIQQFEFEGETYYFPKPVYEEETFGAYIESSHLLSVSKELEGKEFAVIAEHMAIMCRKKNEEYSDKLVKKRKEVFKRLPMNIVWQYSFFLSRQKQTYESNMKHYLRIKQLNLPS